MKIGQAATLRHGLRHREKISVLKAPAKKTGKRVAIIGGGRRDSAVRQNSRNSVIPVVFEKKPQAGGAQHLRHRLLQMAPQVSLDEVEMIKSLGVEFRCVESRQGHHRRATGAGVRRHLCRGRLERQPEAWAFPAKICRRSWTRSSSSKRFTANRCIRSRSANASRSSAAATRRLTRSRNPNASARGTQPSSIAAAQATCRLYDFEQELAGTDGARFMFNVVPVEVLSSGGHVTGLKLARTASTRTAKCRFSPASEFVEPFDMVIKAIGEENRPACSRNFSPRSNSTIAAWYRATRHRPDESAESVHRRRLRQRRREVVNAVAEGKKTARGIHAMFAGRKVSGPVQASRRHQKNTARLARLRQTHPRAGTRRRIFRQNGGK